MKVYRAQPRLGSRAKEERILADLLLNPGDQVAVVRERAGTYLSRAGSLHELLADPSAVNPAEPDACRLSVAAEVARRYQPPAPERRPSISGPADVVAAMDDIREQDCEHVAVLYLDAHNRIIDRRVVGIGGLRASVMQPRDILGHALQIPAAALVLCHNHPSGQADPSPEDLRVTRQLAEAAKLLGLELLDHVIVAEHEFKSLRELGVGL